MPEILKVISLGLNFDMKFQSFTYFVYVIIYSELMLGRNKKMKNSHDQAISWAIASCFDVTWYFLTNKKKLQEHVPKYQTQL